MSFQSCIYFRRRWFLLLYSRTNELFPLKDNYGQIIGHSLIFSGLFKLFCISFLYLKIEYARMVAPGGYVCLSSLETVGHSNDF